MPLIMIDVLRGRTDEQIKTLLDATHRAVVDSFQVPEGDRYQVLNEHEPSHLVVEDTGLGIQRSPNMVLFTIVTRPRTQDGKEKFYSEITRQLQEQCGIASSDVVVSLVTNADADWSFGYGRAQFLTGEL